MTEAPDPQSNEPTKTAADWPADPQPQAPRQTGLPPRTVGRYRIKSLIGAGGMGSVYVAVQEHPRRTVALKVMKPGIASGSALRRFEYESQLLARLQHPNIAHVYEAGTHDDGAGGVPYFAMEYIPNSRTITEYAQEQKLGTRACLALFAKVCDAVHHGHQKGIIHRDLKPDNILVDSHGEPKIIDFGVARATDSDMALTTLQTDVGQLVGTIQYMSPEQCRADPHDLDTRSDVYALGVILYELLCGRAPYDVSRIAVHEAARIILEQPPARPSTLDRTLRGDVETITLKAMDKDRTRRYRSASDLGNEIRRYLDGEPIMGRPPSVAYQLSLLARRHRAAFGAIAAVVAVLVMAAVVSTLFAIRARVARDEAAAAAAAATGARVESDRQRDAAVEATTEAQWQAYVANVTAAEAALRDNASDAARQRLDRAPEHLRGWEWSHFRSRLDQSDATLQADEHGMRNVAFSPDGERLVSGSENGVVRPWDVATRRILLAIDGHARLVAGVDVRPDGAVMASCSATTVKLWDASDGALLAELPTGAPIFCVRYSDGGRLLAAGEEDGTIRLWDAASRRELRAWPGHASPVAELAFSPDGRRLASASQDRTVRIWDVATGAPVGAPLEHLDWAWAVAYSPDGTSLASGGVGQVLRIWDADSGRELAVGRGHTDRIYSLVYTPDGRTIVTASADRTVRFWDASSGQLLVTRRGHGQLVRAIDVDPRGDRVATASWDATIKLWDATTLGDAGVLRAHRHLVSSVGFSADGALIVSASGPLEFPGRATPGRVLLLDAVTGETVAELRGHEQGVLGISASPDGQWLATASVDETARLWEARTGEAAAVLNHEGWLTGVEFSADGARLATTSSRGTVKVWDVASGSEVMTLGAPGAHRQPEFDPTAVAFSPDGRLVAVDLRTVVQVWHLAEKRPIATLQGHKEVVEAVAFSPDGALIATGSWDTTIRLWDTRAFETVATLRGHANGIADLAFSPDGSRLASASWDKTIGLWDVATGELLATLRGHDDRVQSLAFSPDGTRLVSGSWDTTIRLWDIVPDAELRRRRAEALEARAAVEPVVDGLFGRGLEPKQVVALLQADESLNEVYRRQALHLVLARSADPGVPHGN